jgi:hypothetical protein
MFTWIGMGPIDARQALMYAAVAGTISLFLGPVGAILGAGVGALTGLVVGACLKYAGFRPTTIAQAALTGVLINGTSGVLLIVCVIALFGGEPGGGYILMIVCVAVLAGGVIGGSVVGYRSTRSAHTDPQETNAPPKLIATE